MSNPNDDGYAREVIRTVSAMTQKLEHYTQAGDEARKASDEARKLLQETVENTVVAMRKDMHVAIISLQLDASQHKDEHIAERKERAADLIARTRRQYTHDLWMGALTLLGVVNLGLWIYLATEVVKIVQAAIR